MKRLLLITMSLLSLFGLQAADFQSVDVKEFAKVLQQENTFLLDVRTEKEFAEGHLKGSICIDVTQADFLAKAEKQLPKDKTIALYCRSGRRSKKAAELLANAGYKVVELYSGLLSWQSSGMPVE
ncbi:MAG: rhodanese-like domain-containing protein [Paludibacteraceae bacterium]